MSSIVRRLCNLPGNGFLLISFLLIWTSYYAILLLLGYKSKYDNFEIAIILQLLFIFLTAVPIIFLPSPSRKVAPPHFNLNFVVYAGIGLSIFGIGCLLTDKILIGIDYAKDICSARSQMVDLAQGREGVRSIYSFLGNLLSTSFFVSIVGVITQNVTRKNFYIVTASSFICLMIYSFIASSRTPLMLFGAFVLASLCIRFWMGNKLPKFSIPDLVFCIVMLVIASAFVAQIFACRASNSNMTTIQYEQKFADFLGAVENQDELAGPESNETMRSKVRGIGGVTALYFVHSAYIFSGIISTDERPGQALFSYAKKLLKKIGLVRDKEDVWFFSGKFPSLPGGLYYDFNIIGMLIGAALIGFMAWGAGHLLAKFPNSMIMAGITSAIYVIMFMSPLLFAGDIMAFPFICFSFLLIPAMAYCFEKIGLIRKDK